jgi:hypothetical protein
MRSAKLLSVLGLGIGLLGMTTVASNADTFTLTSCHISGSSCEGGPFQRRGLAV